MEREEMIERLKRGEDPLEVSIIAWEGKQRALPQRYFLNMSQGVCALCHTSNGMCKGCIIRKHTGRMMCKDTPYRDCVIEPTRYNAGRMIMFLKSLRED